MANSLQLDDETAAYVRSTPKMTEARRDVLLRSVVAGRSPKAGRKQRAAVEPARREIAAGTIRLAVDILGDLGVDPVPAEDALSIATLAIYDAIDGFDPGRGRFAHYLRLRIRRGLAVAQAAEFRWSATESLEGLVDEGFDSPDPVDGFEAIDAALDDSRVRVVRRVSAAVFRLPPRRRSYALRRFGLLKTHVPLTLREIADEDGVSHQAVGKALELAAVDLRVDLADLDPAA